MIENFKQSKLLKELFYNNKIALYSGFFSLFLISSLALFLGINVELYLFVILAIFGIFAIYLFLNYPWSWLYTIALTFALFFREEAEGVTTSDIIFGGFYFGSLYIWLFWYSLIKKRKLIKSTGDWFIFAFLFLMILNLFIALFNEVSALEWLRPSVMFSLILYYFPIREYFQEKKNLKRFLFIVALSVLEMDYIQYYEYIKVSQNYQYAYEMLHSERNVQTYFTAGTIAGMIFCIFEKNMIKRIIYLIFTSLTLGAVISTFARTYWIYLLFSTVIIFLLSGKIQKLRIFGYSITMSILISFLIFFLYKDNSKIFVRGLEYRLQSSTQGKKDISLQSRFAEYKVEYDFIKQFPLGGNGSGKLFHFYDPVNSNSKITNYQHNGYLLLFYRFGIPLGLIYIFILYYFMHKGYKNLFNQKDKFNKIISITSFLTLTLLIVANLVSSQFYTRDAVFILAISIALINIAEKNKQMNRDPQYA